MASDLRVVLPNRPGALVACLQALASVGIELNGFCGDLRPGEAWGFVHVLVDDAAGAHAALQQAGFEVTSQHEVDLLDLRHHAGSLAGTARRYSDEGRNIEVLYLTTDGHVVVGTEDMQAERYGVRTEDARY